MKISPPKARMVLPYVATETLLCNGIKLVMVKDSRKMTSKLNYSDRERFHQGAVVQTCGQLKTLDFSLNSELYLPNSERK